MEALMDLWPGLVKVCAQRLEGATADGQCDSVGDGRRGHQAHPGGLYTAGLLEDERTGLPRLDSQPGDSLSSSSTLVSSSGRP